jgi:hypothetical protein
MEISSVHFHCSIIATKYIIILTAGSSRTEVAMHEIQYKPKTCKIHENWAGYIIHKLLSGFQKLIFPALSDLEATKLKTFFF